MHHLYSVVENKDDSGNKSKHLIDLLVEEVYNSNIDGTFRRAYQLKEIKEHRLPGANPFYHDEHGINGDARPGRLNVKTVSELFALVKEYDKNFKPKEASKVVDANGEPLVVYHGSNTGGFSVFNTEGKGKTEGTGAWFTSRNDAAFTYSGTTDLMEIYEEDGETYSCEGNYNYPVFLNIRTPYVMECGGRSWDHLGDIVIYNEQTGEEILEKSDGTPFENEDDAWRYISEIGGEDSRFYTVFSDAQTTDDIARAVRNGDYNDGEAHDGVLFKDINDSGPHGTEYVSDVYVAFNPEQIKSATDNRGTFDAGDANIYHQLLAERARDKLQADTPEAEAARKAAGEVFEQLKELNGNLDTPLEERVLQDQSALYGHYLLAINKKYGVPIEEAHRVKVAAGADPAGYFQRMFHGTRHNLGGRFDLLKIGTGEGAQFYAWGSYLAENRDVSETYRTAGGDNSAQARVTFTGASGEKIGRQQYRNAPAVISAFFARLADNEAAREMGQEAPSLQEVAKQYIDGIREKAAKANNEEDRAYWRQAVERLEELTPVAAEIAPENPGNLYTVEGPENFDLLDWDKPMYQQPEKVDKAVRRLVRDMDEKGQKGLLYYVNAPESTGEKFYSVLGDMLKPDGTITEQKKAASLLLNEYGIPGTRYLDQGSRGDGEGTHNFVIWNTDTLKILGVEGPAAEMETYAQARTGLTQDQIDEMTAGQIEAVRKQYEGTDQWMKAPNGKQTNLTEKQWLQVRTPAFKEWFGDWETAAEVEAMHNRLILWTSQDNLDKARGKSREEIFKEFGNELHSIAYIPEGYLKFLDPSITDNRVYSGLGYFLDHAVNHHQEVATEKYLGIQQVIDTADDVKLDARGKSKNNSILFIKNVGAQGVVVVSFNEGKNGKIVLHKTFFDKFNAGRFDKLPSIKLSPEVGHPSISPKAEASAAGHLPALDDNDRIPNPIRAVNPGSVSCYRTVIMSP